MSMHAGRHHDVTEFELTHITRSRELSQAVKARADLEASPQVALAKLCRDMGSRAVLEILREIDDPTTPAAKRDTAGALSFATLTACAHCGQGFKPTGPRRVYCSDACMAAGDPKRAHHVNTQRKRRAKSAQIREVAQ